MSRLLALLFLTVTSACATLPPPSPNVRMVPDEAYSVLTILDKRHRGETVTEADWGQVFGSEGYVRLKAREHSMQRKFEDSTFREFVMSEALLARRVELASTLRSWLAADISRSRELALAYLPKGARLRAKVYPVIKPATNSFVFDLEGDPAIFMYVEPQPREVFEATIAHELAPCRVCGELSWYQAGPVDRCVWGGDRDAGGGWRGGCGHSTPR